MGRITYMNQKGFTLVELMVAIAIMGILAFVAVPKLTGALAKAHASEIVPSSAAYVKLQKAYMFERGGVGTWRKIGYAAPGAKTVVDGKVTYVASSFVYGGSDIEITGSIRKSQLKTSLSKGKYGWVAENSKNLNGCMKGNKWYVKVIADSDTSVQYVPEMANSNVSALCLALVPGWGEIDYGSTSNSVIVTANATPVSSASITTSTSGQPETSASLPPSSSTIAVADDDSNDLGKCAKTNGWLNGVKNGWEHSHPQCYALRNSLYEQGKLICTGNTTGNGNGNGNNGNGNGNNGNGKGNGNNGNGNGNNGNGNGNGNSDGECTGYAYASDAVRCEIVGGSGCGN